eukprot:7400621-Pyramimonas_sp.AAC.1
MSFGSRDSSSSWRTLGPQAAGGVAVNLSTKWRAAAMLASSLTSSCSAANPPTGRRVSNRVSPGLKR